MNIIMFSSYVDNVEFKGLNNNDGISFRWNDDVGYTYVQQLLGISVYNYVIERDFG